MTIADLVIKISADSKTAEKDITSLGSRVGGGFKKALVPAVAALGALGVVGAVAFHNLQDGAKNAAQTSAVITSTGGAANVTAKHVDQLAMSLRRKAGVDDDVIHSGENMLLTFTNVRNEVGKGNNIFDQATRTMLDMSTALGQDTKSSAIQLGKALNDPIKGVTALQRVGVTFTAAQKKQIKTLVDSGHAMDAQKLILRELNKEFGGSATKIDPMQKSIANLKLDATDFASSLVSGLLPAFSAFLGFLGSGTAFLQQHQTAVKIVGLAIAGLAVAVIAVNAAMAVYTAGAAVVRAATTAWTAVQWLLNTAFMSFPLIFIVAAIAAVIAIIVVAWTHCETFRNIVTAAWNAIKSVTMTVFNFVRDHIKQIMAAIFVILTGGLGALVLLVIAKWDAIRSTTVAAWNTIKGAVMTVVDGIKTGVSAGFNALDGIVSTALETVRTTASTVWNGIKKIFTTAVAAIRTAVGGLTGVFNGIIGVLHAVEGAAQAAASAVEKVVSMAGKVGGALSHLKPGGGIPFIGGHANGGRNLSGLAVVGERGPELVNLPGGSDVLSNADSRAAVSNGFSGMGLGGVGGDEDTVIIMDGEKVGKLVRRRMYGAKRRTGGLRFEAGS